MVYVEFLVATANAVVDLAIGWSLLSRCRRRGRVGLPHLLLGGLVVGLSLVAKLFFVVPGVVRGWGVAQLLWIELLVVPPVIGLRLLLWRGRVTAAARAVGASGVLLVPVLGYAHLVAPFDLRVERVVVALDPARAGEHPLRVAVLADLQTAVVGEHERDAVELLVAEAPDLILIPGDVYQGAPESFEAQLPTLRALFDRLASVAPVLLVGGDCDEPDELRRLTAGSSVRLLDDESVTLRIANRDVQVFGLPNECRNGPSAAAVRRFEDAPGDRDIRIVVAHKPDAIDRLRPGTRVDLLVAGHTHGGQVVIPGFGPPLTFTTVPRQVAAGGLHELERRRIYVSRGVGFEQAPAPRVRLFCPPEVSLLTLSSGASR